MIEELQYDAHKNSFLQFLNKIGKLISHLKKKFMEMTLNRLIWLTIFSFALRIPNFPNLTWKGEERNVPSWKINEKWSSLVFATFTQTDI